jgi:cobalamin biosynthesis Mg chelatase CobN
LLHIIDDNSRPGLSTTVTRLANAVEISNKRKENTWKWAVPAVLFSISLVGVVITDHFTLKQAPQTYVTQKVMAQWLSEFQNMAKALEKMAASKTIEEMQKYREEFEKHSKTFDYMNTTRGGKTKENESNN